MVLGGPLGPHAREFHVILDEMNLARVEHYFSPVPLGDGGPLARGDRPARPGARPRRRAHAEPEVRRHREHRRDDARVRRQGLRPRAAARAPAAARTTSWSTSRASPYARRGPRRSGTPCARSRRSDSACSRRCTTTWSRPVRSTSTWEVALDEQLVQKVLPRVRGADGRLDEALEAFLGALGDGFPLGAREGRDRCARTTRPMASPATSEEATPLVVLMEIVRGVEGRPGLAEVVLRSAADPP